MKISNIWKSIYLWILRILAVILMVLFLITLITLIAAVVYSIIGGLFPGSVDPQGLINWITQSIR